MKLSIVIPCYNESKRINMLFDALADFSKKWKYDYEILIVDDGSTDGVVDIIKSNSFVSQQITLQKFRLIELPANKGKGNALQEGVRAATGTHVLTMDADLSYHPNLVIDWIAAKGTFSDKEILVGSRLKKGSVNTWEDNKQTPSKNKLRMVFGYIFSGITKILTTIKVKDNQSGFKLYPAELAKYLFANLKIKGWAHDVELLYKADLNRFTITEMPVTCINRGGSKINVITDSIKMFLQTLFLALRMRLNYYIIEPVKILLGNTALIPPVENKKRYKTEALYRLLFSITTIMMFIILPYISKDYGISGDEIVQNNYGHDIYNYFSRGDSAAYSEIGRANFHDAVINYSGGYELVLVTVAKLFPHVFEFDVRHFIDAIFGCFLFFFTGLFAKRLGGWRVGFMALVFILLSPRLFGEIMNNSKDMPYALGMIFTMYHFIPFLRDLPKPSWRSVILIGLGIGLTLNARIGGLLLYAYLGLFGFIIYVIKYRNKEFTNFFGKDFQRIVGMLLVMFVISYIIGISLWPFALQAPISNPLKSLEMMSKFPVTVQVLFNGEMINSGMPPWNYTLLWIFRTSPEIVLLGFLLSILFIIPLYRYYKSEFIFFLLFVTIFPVAYAVYKGSGLYDGWRHFLFIYPTMVISAALLFGYLIEKSKNNATKLAIGGVVGAGLVLPLRKIIAYHPHQYVYFNDISGGLKGNYKKFETDYYMNSGRECFFALAEKESFASLKDTIVLQTNMYKEMIEYAKLVSPYIKVDYSKFERRTDKAYDYGIYFGRFVEYDLLKNDGWPAKNAIVTIERDGVPLSFAIKNTHKGDYLGTQAMGVKDMVSAIAHFEAYLKTDPTNEGVLGKLGECYVSVGENEKAIAVLTQAMKVYPNVQNRSMLGIAYAQNQNPQKALELFGQGVKQEKAIFEASREALMKNREDMNAYQNVQIAAAKLANYYYYMSMVYNQLGDQQQAQSYMKLSQQFKPQ